MYKEKKCQRATSGFARAGVYARRHFCADFQACSPPKPLWNPRLREAATTLAASEGQRSGKMSKFETNKKE